MSKSVIKQSSTGMDLSHKSFIGQIKQLFSSSKKTDKPTNAIDIPVKKIVSTKQRKTVVVKKSARIITSIQEGELKPVVLSINGIEIALTPVSSEEERSKRVDGYRYLSI